MKNKKKYWIAWERHRRTLEMCKFLNIEGIIFNSKSPRIFKHPRFFIKSLYFIHMNKPRILICQNPSVLLAVMACAVKGIYKYELIVDSHNAGLIPDIFILKKLKIVYKYIQKRADLTIVTNESLSELVRNNGGKPFVLPDILPQKPKVKRMKLRGSFNIVFVCTFGVDEPYEQVLNAGIKLPPNVNIYVTGNNNKLPQHVKNNTSKNIVFTGFLPDEEYYNLLYSSDIVMDLTDRENCLVAGAYEALTFDKPLILSNTLALRRYFYKGVIFTNNNTEEIKDNILLAINSLSQLKFEIGELKLEIMKNWYIQGNQLKQFLNGKIKISDLSR